MWMISPIFALLADWSIHAHQTQFCKDISVNELCTDILNLKMIWGVQDVQHLTKRKVKSCDGNENSHSTLFYNSFIVNQILDD